MPNRWNRIGAPAFQRYMSMGVEGTSQAKVLSLTFSGNHLPKWVQKMLT